MCYRERPEEGHEVSCGHVLAYLVFRNGVVEDEMQLTDVIPGRNELDAVCDWVPYRDGGDRFPSKTRLGESRVLVQNRRREIPSLRPRRFSA